MTNYALVSRCKPLDLGDEDSSKHNERLEVVSIFESYAQIYPNPRLMEEHEERDRLLRQVAMEQAMLQESQHAPPRKTGLFGFLRRQREPTTVEYDISNLNEEALLEYEEEDLQDSMLCGTQSLLEMECIPQEAYSVARFHLASVKTRRYVPNVARSFEVSRVIIVNVGVVVDLEENLRMETSDKEDLEEYISSLDGQYDVSYARAVTIGNDLLLVSWGLPDGVVVAYRRIPTVGWESFAMLSPTSAVLANLQVSPAQAKEGFISSSLLYVTDMVPMTVENPDRGIPVVTLAVSRLGGYIELIILPARLLTGPVPKSTRRKRKRQDNATRHYAHGSLHNLCTTAEVGVAALTTSNYHVDVLCLETHRTSVGSDTEWDAGAFPPAEYVLVASGTKNGHQKVSFWGISTLFPEMPVEGQGVSLHVSFIDALDIDGTQLSVFASPTMLNHWRKARCVRLRRTEAGQSIEDEDIDETNENHETIGTTHSADVGVNLVSNLPLSTLSTSVPIVRLRLTTKAGSEEIRPAVLLATLDGNGGVVIIDCTTAVGLVAHDVPKEWLDKPALSLSCRLPPLAETFVDIEWLHGELVTVMPRVIQVLNLPIFRQSDSVDLVRFAQLSHSLDVPSMARGAAIIKSNHSGGLSFVAFRKAGRTRRILCHGTLQFLASSTVIDMLMKSSKFAEAISSAESMNVPGSTESIQLCHKRLWERDGDVHHLSAVIDEKYVVKAALSIFRNGVTWATMDLSVAREALLLAIKRVSILRVDDLEETEKLATKISSYILLCKCQGAQPLLVAFRKAFLPASLSQMAAEFASKGDISCLTIIFFRHRRELLQCRLDILDRIPLHTPPAAYSHLLPVLKAEGVESDCFYHGGHDNGGLRKWFSMGEYANNTYGIKLFLDDHDEELIWNRCRTPDDSSVDLESGFLPKWYLARANRIQREIGSVSLLRDFCECALQRLGVSLSSMPTQNSDAEILELYSLYTFTIQLDGMMTDASITSSSPKLSTNALAVMNASDIEKLSVEDRVLCMIGLPDNPMDVLAKLRAGYMFLALGKSAELGHLEHTIDHAVSTYCRKAVLNAVAVAENHDIPVTRKVSSLHNALVLCKTIANASRSTIRRSKRVVKDTTTLMNLTIEAAYNTSRACKLIALLPSDCRYIIDSIWESYECLPARLAPDVASQSGVISVQKEVDRLYQNLVAVDILSRWSSSVALCYLVDLRNAEVLDNRSAATDTCGRTQLVTVGATMLNEICCSFCHQVSTVNYAAASRKEFDLMDDLISDVEQLNKVGFDDSLPLAPTLRDVLIKPLLQQEKCELIIPLANRIGRDEVEATVLAFINEAMFRDDELMTSMTGMASGDRVQAAIKCQDILGPHLPGLCDAFESIRRYFDAARFINSLLPDTEFSSPHAVRDTPPLDIIESLIARNLRCILEGCGDWAQPAFSKKANGVICSHYRSMRERNAHASSHDRDTELPILPGTAVYQLASLLGLKDQCSLLIVKARVAHHAVLGGLFAAAAAVCATMIYESGPLWDNPAVAQCIADSVAKVVSVNNYGDIRMKTALCNGLFEHHRSNLSILDSRAYETVLDSFITLEHETSCFRRPQEPASISPTSDGRAPDIQGTNMGTAPSGSDFLVFRAAGMVVKTAQTVVRHANVPTNQSILGGNLSMQHQAVTPPSMIARVYHGILSESSTDVRNLFWILRGASTSSRVDDALLLTLGRLVVFWCISDALQLRLQDLSPEPDRADFKDALALGMSLLLHSQDEKVLISCIGELQGILKRETEAVERGAACARSGSVMPAPNIVRSLITRGYSENGARRAAIMTGNQSPEVALVWAVSHSLDYGFDDPMVFLASLDGSSSPKRIDQYMIHQLQDTLGLMNNYISRTQTLNSLLPAQQVPSKSRVDSQKRSTESTDTKRCSGNGQNRAKSGNGQKISPTSLPLRMDWNRRSETLPSHVRTSGSPIGAKPKAVVISKINAPVTPTASSQLSESMKPAVITSSKLLPSTGHQRIGDGSNFGSPAAKSKLVVPTVIPKRGTKTAAAAATTRTATASSGDLVSLTASPQVTDSPSSFGHSLLPSRGIYTKSTTTDLTNDERRRLMAEGRRILQQARASRGATIISSNPTDSPAASNRVGRYPLRSRLAALESGTSSEEKLTEVTISLSTADAPNPSPTENADQDDFGDGWDFDDF